MTLLSWSNQYAIGDDVIDTEHEELFNLVNRFHSEWLEARDRQSIGRVFNQLVAYAEMHFRHEETIMAEHEFPQLEKHKQQHEAMVDTIFRLHRDYMEENLSLEVNTMKFIKSWLVEHVLESDYRFRDFLARKKGVGETIEQPAE
ncbi:MAG: bacteriohemerythrin [Propionivibrio sp.]